MTAGAVALLAASVAALPGGAQMGAIPVTVGGDGDLDACTSLGEVTGLNPRGDNFLAVRMGPSTDFTKVDEIYTGDVVHVCETRGRWYGIVYAPGGQPSGACGVNRPSPLASYRGPCRSGWVFDRYLLIIAG